MGFRSNTIDIHSITIYTSTFKRKKEKNRVSIESIFLQKGSAIMITVEDEDGIKSPNTNLGSLVKINSILAKKFQFQYRMYLAHYQIPIQRIKSLRLRRVQLTFQNIATAGCIYIYIVLASQPNKTKTFFAVFSFTLKIKPAAFLFFFLSQQHQFSFLFHHHFFPFTSHWLLPFLFSRFFCHLVPPHFLQTHFLFDFNELSAVFLGKSLC